MLRKRERMDRLPMRLVLSKIRVADVQSGFRDLSGSRVAFVGDVVCSSLYQAYRPGLSSSLARGQGRGKRRLRDESLEGRGGTRLGDR